MVDKKQLLATALELADSDRVDLAPQLLDSVDGDIDPDAETAWSAEIARRIATVDAGTAQTMTWEEARRRIVGNQ